MAALDEHIAFSIFRLLIMVISVTGNALSLFIILANKKMRQKGTNLLFAQLAFADFVLGLGAGARGLSTILFQHRPALHEKGLCLMLGSPTVFGVHLSQTTMIAIAFDRFLCVRFPVFYRHSVLILESERPLVSITLTYSLQECSSFLLPRCIACILYSCLGTAASYIGVSFGDKVTICSTGTAITAWYSTYWLVFATVLTVILYLAYITIYVLFRRQSASAFGKSSTQRAVFGTVTALLVSYFVLWCAPNVLFVVFKYNDFPAPFLGYIGVLTGVGGALSSTTNVFIYGWKHPELKCQLKKMLGRLKVAKTTSNLVRSMS
uniref:G_PROTEIN_RECEP_F1_2 domain-containing protein n=1 Tax=Steinernema glaseri TaxID=37863 RepID=A0A1I7ZV35_9BILA